MIGEKMIIEVRQSSCFVIADSADDACSVGKGCLHGYRDGTIKTLEAAPAEVRTAEMVARFFNEGADVPAEYAFRQFDHKTDKYTIRKQATPDNVYFVKLRSEKAIEIPEPPKEEEAPVVNKITLEKADRPE